MLSAKKAMINGGEERFIALYEGHGLKFDRAGDASLSKIMVPHWESRGIRPPKDATYYDVRKHFKLGNFRNGVPPTVSETITTLALKEVEYLDEYLKGLTPATETEADIPPLCKQQAMKMLVEKVFALEHFCCTLAGLLEMKPPDGPDPGQSEDIDAILFPLCRVEDD